MTTYSSVLSETSDTDAKVQTMEVATARVYNWDVAERRKEKGDGKSTADEPSKFSPNG